MTENAKPCPKCKMYYPGDCASYGCKDVENCPCDGCETERYLAYGVDEEQSED